MTVQVHVNVHIIRANAKHGKTDAPITIRRGKTIERAHEVELVGPCRVVYRPDKPLKCGAKVWIEAKDARVV